ncbi:MAG TPA: bacterial transcriptional activator domain-containing protein, partial [Gammaproteobacteria bacterium]
ERFGQMLERKQQWTNAIEWYRRGLEVDLLAEQFYQRLMHCYEQLDRRGDAVEVYRQCYRVMVASLGVEPSDATKAIFKSVRKV